MGRLAQITARLSTASALAAVLSGCGYRELKAPCGPDEGKLSAASWAMSYAPVASPPMTGSPLEEIGGGGIPVADPCGPLRRINNSLAMVADRSTADDPP